jgi:hypothetical protein
VAYHLKKLISTGEANGGVYWKIILSIMSKRGKAEEIIYWKKDENAANERLKKGRILENHTCRISDLNLGENLED